MIAAGLVVAGGLLTAASFLPPPPAADAPRISGASIYVIDGDTLRLPDGERVRLLGIDAPEMPPRAQCEREITLAYAAKARMTELVRSGAVALYAEGREDRDRYKRLLRRVTVDGRDVGDTLVGEGLAQVWQGRKAQWC